MRTPSLGIRDERKSGRTSRCQQGYLEHRNDIIQKSSENFPPQLIRYIYYASYNHNFHLIIKVRVQQQRDARCIVVAAALIITIALSIKSIMNEINQKTNQQQSNPSYSTGNGN